MKAKIVLDWDPYKDRIPTELERGLLVYAIYMWSSGKGGAITNPQTYSLKRLMGTYGRIRKEWLSNRSGACHYFPSPSQLIDLHRRGSHHEREYIEDVLVRYNLSDLAIDRVSSIYRYYHSDAYAMATILKQRAKEAQRRQS